MLGVSNPESEKYSFDLSFWQWYYIKK